MSTREPFPWDDAMRFGFGVLRLSPDQFWRMTPRELAFAAQARGIARPLKRADFLQLMERYPDVGNR